MRALWGGCDLVSTHDSAHSSLNCSPVSGTRAPWHSLNILPPALGDCPGLTLLMTMFLCGHIADSNCRQ